MAFTTQAQVDRLRLPAGKTEHWEFDQRCTGLSVRLQGAKRTFVVWYQVNGKRRKISLGDCAAIRLEHARREAARIVAGAKDGQDALAERAAKRQRAQAKAADTLGRLVAVYLERHAKPRQRPRSYVETSHNLLKVWAPLHALPVGDVTRRHVAEQLERIRTKRGPTAARNARGYLSGCFAWAMRQGLAEANPVIGTAPPPVPPSKARVLGPQELAEIWNAAGDDAYGRIVRLLMLTGQRREEIAAMVWPEIDRQRNLWTIPPARTKNRREHEVPMSSQALALLPEQHDGSDWLFGTDGPYAGFSHAKERLDQRILAARREVDPKAKPMPGWRLHDLRYSFVTYANEIGVEPHIIETAVNHVSGHRGGIAGRYNAARYREQKRAAMQRFADWLEGVVSGEAPASKVVELRHA